MLPRVVFHSLIWIATGVFTQPYPILLILYCNIKMKPQQTPSRLTIMIKVKVMPRHVYGQ